VRPGVGDERAREREIQGHRKTHQVEPDGTGRRYMFLPGEASGVRAPEESAEVEVATMPAERREQRRTEESRKDHSPESARSGEEAIETPRSGNCGSFRGRCDEPALGGSLVRASRGVAKASRVRAREREGVQ
jgi:hypothetical protein